MTRGALGDGSDDFGWWYRTKATVVFNLLSVAGPAHLEGDNDPRSVVEHDYERRRDLHRERHGKPPIVKKSPSTGGFDVVWVCAVSGVVALLVLVAWAVGTV